MNSTQQKNITYSLIAAALLICFNIIYVSFSTGFVHQAAVVLETDHYHYIEMARGPEHYAGSWRAHEAPFCWRLFTPYFAFLLTRTGLHLNPAYYLITNIFLFGFLFIIYLFLRTSGFDLKYSLLGMTLVGLTPGAVRWYEYQYWMSDPAGLFFIFLAFYLIRTRRDNYLLPLSVIAVINRGSYLIVFIYYFLFLLKNYGWRKAMRKTSAIAVVPIITILIIHYYIILSRPHNMGMILNETITFRYTNLWSNQLYLLTVGSLGIIFPLLLVFPKKIIKYCKREYDSSIFVLLIYGQLAIANNTDRLLAYALPVLLPAALWNLKKFSLRSRIPPAVLMISIFMLQILFYTSTKFYRQFAISVFQPTNLTVVVSFGLFWILSQVIPYLKKYYTILHRNN